MIHGKDRENDIVEADINEWLARTLSSSADIIKKAAPDVKFKFETNVATNEIKVTITRAGVDTVFVRKTLEFLKGMSDPIVTRLLKSMHQGRPSKDKSRWIASKN